ncbi:hypothetical protein B0J11DRAFT_539292 [Dendryphion nanum]|uniref:C2H2-type domain-containing protein n=1 Tax=Dendryphion nanum TaxID=256645 RepID=A0A9P9DC59_9PLEO|nr:hypothetical protein B0J11DRAFT_539292 [Dendryphion nanum]
MPVAQRRQSILNLECGTCHKQYTKKEHLQRHERTHTGVRPFVCQLCGRSFARQDALNRHIKIHSHNGSNSIHSAGSSDMSPPGLETVSPNGLQHSDIDAPHSTHIPSADAYNMQQHPSITTSLPMNSTFYQPQLNGSSLFWPDSEDLLQNIMSIDPSLWEQPISLMQPALNNHISLITTTSNVNEDISPTSAGEGHRAIQTLSTLLSNTVQGVTTPAVLANLTSRFLDSCLHMFFSTFIPMIPIIHRPTFVFRECSPPLLLNAIAIGSLFLGTSEATVKGEALWRLAHTAVATSWHTMISQKGEFDTCGGVQLVLTALLSQVYAALAKSRTLRMTSQVFHGLGIYWARYCGLFDLPELATFPSSEDPPEIKYQAWRTWLGREVQLRTLLGLYILDGIISQFSGNPTFAQHMSNTLPLPSDEDTFNATNEDDWLQHVLRRDPVESRMRFCDLFHKFFHPDDDLTSDIPTNLSLFSFKVALEGFKSLVAESKRIEPPPIGVPSHKDINLVLDRLRLRVEASTILTQVEKSTVMLRWHAICLDSLGNTARGARRLCYPFGIKQHIFGGGERHEGDINPLRWINSDRARRTLLHASEIHHIASQLPLGSAHDPYIPGAVFAVATTYAAFALAGFTRVVFPRSVDWAVTVLLPKQDPKNQQDGDWGGGDVDVVEKNTVRFIRGVLEDEVEGKATLVRDLSYELSSMRLLLRGLTLQWGVSFEMEKVVDAWIAKCA